MDAHSQQEMRSYLLQSAPGGLVSQIIRPMVENEGDGVSCKGEETHHE